MATDDQDILDSSSVRTPRVFSDIEPETELHTATQLPHRQGSPVSIAQDLWSIGSPVLSITSVDPESPSLKFKDRSHIHGFDDERSRAADLRGKASNYLQYLESLSQAYESQLGALCAFFKRQGGLSCQQPSYSDEPAVEMIEVNSDGSRRLIAIDDVETLIDYFSEDELLDCPVVSKAIFVERLDASVMGVLGAKLGIEPQFWDAHLNLANHVGIRSGQVVRYGTEQGSRISFLNIPLLRRTPSLVGGQSPDESFQQYEGCSIHMDYSTRSRSSSTSTVLILTSKHDSGDKIAQENVKPLRTSFIEELMCNSGSQNSRENNHQADVTLDLILDLIKTILHQFESTLASVPEYTNSEISNFTVNIFRDESEKMRRSISEEQVVISTLLQGFQTSLAAFEEIGRRKDSDSSDTVQSITEKLQPLIDKLHDQGENVQRWLKDLDDTVIDHRRKREARLRRLRITVPLCSVSAALTIAIVLFTKFWEGPVKVDI